MRRVLLAHLYGLGVESDLSLDDPTATYDVVVIHEEPGISLENRFPFGCLTEQA